MRNGLVVVDAPRADLSLVDALAGYGVATIHEAIGRAGLLDHRLRPIRPGIGVAGSAVTSLCPPGDNLMIHVAVEQCQPGDVLVVATTAACHDGMVGELLATSLRSRGVRGLVIDAGVRDVAALRTMGFPVWSSAICAQGTAKATAGSVNVPVVIGTQRVCPGDAMIADDDGVVCVAGARLREALAASRDRVAKEDETRRALGEGQLGLDRYGLRTVLERLGVRYVSHADYLASGEAEAD